MKRLCESFHLRSTHKTLTVFTNWQGSVLQELIDLDYAVHTAYIYMNMHSHWTFQNNLIDTTTLSLRKVKINIHRHRRSDCEWLSFWKCKCVVFTNFKYWQTAINSVRVLNTRIADVPQGFATPAFLVHYCKLAEWCSVNV